jgi:hypothetical protein
LDLGRQALRHALGDDPLLQGAHERSPAASRRAACRTRHSSGRSSSPRMYSSPLAARRARRRSLWSL